MAYALSTDSQICFILIACLLLCYISITSQCGPEEHVEEIPVVLIKSIPRVELPDNFHTLSIQEKLKAVYSEDKGLYPSLDYHGLPGKFDYCKAKEWNIDDRYNQLKNHNILCPDGTQYECIQDDRMQIVTEFCGPITECGYRHHYLIILDLDQPHVVKLENSYCPQGFYSMSCYDKQGCHRDASICLAADGYHWYCNAKGGFCNIHGEIYFTLGNTYEWICQHNNTPCAKQEDERLSDCSCGRRCKPGETRTETNQCQRVDSSDESLSPVANQSDFRSPVVTQPDFSSTSHVFSNRSVRPSIPQSTHSTLEDPIVTTSNPDQPSQLAVIKTESEQKQTKESSTIKVKTADNEKNSSVLAIVLPICVTVVIVAGIIGGSVLLYRVLVKAKIIKSTFHKHGDRIGVDAHTIENVHLYTAGTNSDLGTRTGGTQASASVADLLSDVRSQVGGCDVDADGVSDTEKADETAVKFLP